MEADMQARYSVVSENVVMAKALKLDEAIGMAKNFCAECKPIDVGVSIWRTTGTRTIYVGTVWHDRHVIQQII